MAKASQAVHEDSAPRSALPERRLRGSQFAASPLPQRQRGSDEPTPEEKLIYAIFGESFPGQNVKGASSIDAEKAEVSAVDVEQSFSNYSELIERVVDVFDDPIAASKWLSTPSADFGQRTPLEVARANAYQIAAIEPVLIRIEHGVYF